MSLSEFADKHTMAELEEIAALSRVRQQEEEQDRRAQRVEQQAKANRRG